MTPTTPTMNESTASTCRSYARCFRDRQRSFDSVRRVNLSSAERLSSLCRVQALAQVSLDPDLVAADGWPLVFGGAVALAFTLVLGDLVLQALQRTRSLEEVQKAVAARDAKQHAAPWASVFKRARSLGHVERTLYLTALIAGQPVFVGIWLAAKVVGSADLAPGRSRREEDAENSLARATFQRFLLLSGVSLMYAGAGWTVFHAFIVDRWTIVVAPIALVGLSSLLVWELDERAFRRSTFFGARPRRGRTAKR